MFKKLTTSFLILAFLFVGIASPVLAGDILRKERHGFHTDPSCVLHLNFYQQGAEATRIIDQSGNNNHGIVVGPLLQTAGSGSTQAITNGDFESWASATDATGWNENISGASTINREAVDMHGGTFSCRFDIDAGGNYVYLDQSFTLIPNKKYTLSIWYKNSAAAKYLKIRFENSSSDFGMQPNGNWAKGANLIVLPNSTSWKNIQIPFYALPQYSSYLMFVYSDSASSSVYIDDVSVLPNTTGYDYTSNLGVVPDFGLKSDPSLGINILSNGNFETWTDANHPANWTPYAGGTSTVNQDSSVWPFQRYTSVNCLRLDIDAGNDQAGVYREATLTPGKKYRLTVSYKNAGGNAAVRFSDSGGNVSLDSNGNWIAGADWLSNTLSSFVSLNANGTDWKVLDIIFTAHPSYSNFTLVFSSGASSGSSSIYFDEAAIIPLSTPGGVCQGWYFNGVGDSFIYIPEITALNNSSQTFLVWVKPYDNPTWVEPIVLSWLNGQYFLELSHAFSPPRWSLVDNGFLTINTTCDLNQWVCLGVTIDIATSQMSLYKNGALIGSVGYSNPLTGAWITLGVDCVSLQPFWGTAGEILGFNRIFSDQEHRNYYELTRHRYGMDARDILIKYAEEFEYTMAA